MSFPRYPKYKPSGVEWLGDVPEHWEVKPIRKAARLESGHTPSRNHPEYWHNCTVPWFTLADIWQVRAAHRDVVFETREKISELGLANSAARRLPSGTVMLSRTASVGFSAIMGVEMATTQDFANWVCGHNLLPTFLLHVFRSMRSEFHRLMMGSTHNTIYMPDIQAFRFAQPPYSEQRAIAEFLDRETAKIDGLIAEQEKLIELLGEKRQAVISHAVTKGLDPSAPLKPSGVEWLGDVPEHWVVLRLKSLISRPLQYGANEAAELDDRDLPRYVRITDIEDGDALREETFRSLPVEVASDYLLSDGDLLFARSGATAGKSFLYRESWGTCAFAGYLIRARVRSDRCYPSFVRYFTATSGYWQWIASATIQATIQNVSAERFASLPIPIAPLAEQHSIVAFLDRETAKIDGLVSEAKNAIELLRERRSALISAAVTGQIDVRTTVSESIA